MTSTNGRDIPIVIAASPPLVFVSGWQLIVRDGIVIEVRW
jgi:hypothetical protein